MINRRLQAHQWLLLIVWRCWEELSREDETMSSIVTEDHSTDDPISYI